MVCPIARNGVARWCCIPAHCGIGTFSREIDGTLYPLVFYSAGFVLGRRNPAE
jgi:hypothetical protein